jgi:hypothetical protein
MFGGAPIGRFSLGQTPAVVEDLGDNITHVAARLTSYFLPDMVYRSTVDARDLGSAMPAAMVRSGHNAAIERSSIPAALVRTVGKVE